MVKVHVLVLEIYVAFTVFTARMLVVLIHFL